MLIGMLVKIAEALEVVLAIVLFVRILWLYQSLTPPNRQPRQSTPPPTGQEPDDPKAALERYVDGFF